MSFINVGAREGLVRLNVPTKKRLKELVAANDSSLTFYGTSPFTPFNGTLADLDEGVTLSVVGPDPERDRRWYASVKRVNGKIKVT